MCTTNSIKSLKLLGIASLLVAAFSFTSCDNQDKISKSKIAALVTEGLEDDGDLVITGSVKVGYYEENKDEQRYELRKLAAAGVITYKVEAVKRSYRVHDGYQLNYSTYRLEDKYRTVTSDRYFVTVALTEAGQALKYIAPELKPNKEDKFTSFTTHGEFPEDKVAREEVFPWDKQEEPTASDSSNTSSTPSASTPKDEPKTDYDKAKAKESYETVVLNAYKIKVAEEREIRVHDGMANAVYFVEAYDVTPAGRILGGVYEGEHAKGVASFIYYQDKGWVLNENELSIYFH